MSEPLCSFCFKSKSDVKVLLKAPDKLVYICDECVACCKKIVDKPVENNSDGVA